MVSSGRTSDGGYFSGPVQQYQPQTPRYEPIYNDSGRPRVIITERSNALRMFPEGVSPPQTISPSLRAISLGPKSTGNVSSRQPAGNLTNGHHGRREKLHIETGWVNPGKYVSHGRIEEVDNSDLGHLTSLHSPIMNAHAPIPKYLKSLSSLEYGGSPLPAHTTPPPRPAFDNKDLPLTPLVQEFLARYGSANDGNGTGPSPLRICFTPAEATYEDRLVKEITSLIEEALKATDHVAATFIQAEIHVDLREHLEYCELIRSALHSVLGVLAIRGELTEAEKQSASSSWSEKYIGRLEALELTLQRYITLVKQMPPRICKLQKVLEKLCAHHNKLADSAMKIEASFQRLRVDLHDKVPSSHKQVTSSHRTPRKDTSHLHADSSVYHSAQCGSELESISTRF